MHSNGKFEVKSVEPKANDKNPNNVKNDKNLQYFSNFKYSGGYNFVKVKIMKNDKSEEKVCHCYVDLKGVPRGQFIYLMKTMNAKEYTTNAQSEFPLTQLKMSLFLESKKEKAEDQIQKNSDEIDQMKQNFLYSLKKLEKGYVNIYRPNKEV